MPCMPGERVHPSREGRGFNQWVKSNNSSRHDVIHDMSVSNKSNNNTKSNNCTQQSSRHDVIHVMPDSQVGKADKVRVRIHGICRRCEGVLTLAGCVGALVHDDMPVSDRHWM